MITQSVNLTYGGANNIQFTRPVQQVTMLDSSNYAFLRQVMLSNDGVKIIKGNYTVQFPINQLFAVAVQAIPSMSWAPIISTQPTASQYITPSNISLATASLTISASDEFNTVSYKWYVSSSESGTGWQSCVDTTNIKFKNTSSATLSASYSTAWTLDTSSYFCVASNSSGQTSSSIGYVLPT